MEDDDDDQTVVCANLSVGSSKGSILEQVAAARMTQSFAKVATAIAPSQLEPGTQSPAQAAAPYPPRFPPPTLEGRGRGQGRSAQRSPITGSGLTSLGRGGGYGQAPNLSATGGHGSKATVAQTQWHQ